MFHFKTPAEGWDQHISAQWGQCTRYIEVLDDQLASRTIEIYKNGNVLKYDRSHRSDEFGMLFGAKFSKKPKWRKFFPEVEMLTKAEFDQMMVRYKGASQAATVSLLISVGSSWLLSGLGFVPEKRGGRGARHRPR